jgi:hypothetical protein
MRAAAPLAFASEADHGQKLGPVDGVEPAISGMKRHQGCSPSDDGGVRNNLSDFFSWTLPCWFCCPHADWGPSEPPSAGVGHGRVHRPNLTRRTALIRGFLTRLSSAPGANLPRFPHQSVTMGMGGVGRRRQHCAPNRRLLVATRRVPTGRTDHPRPAPEQASRSRPRRGPMEERLRCPSTCCPTWP